MYWQRPSGSYGSQPRFAHQLRSDSSQVNFNVSNPRMQFKSDRLSSFAHWPNHIRADKETLADAGLYYLGIKDRTKCFVCDGGLENWEFDDDPFYEHAKFFPRCEFIRSIRGNQYVDGTAAQNPNLPPPKVYMRSNTPSEDEDHSFNGNTSSLVFVGPPYVSDVESSFIGGPIQIGSPLVHRPQNGSQIIMNHVESVSEIKTRSANVPSLEHGNERNSRAPQSNIAKNGNEVEKRIAELKDEERCKICLDHETESVFGPCGHLCACMECSRKLSTCPICRQRIEKVLKISRG